MDLTPSSLSKYDRNLSILKRQGRAEEETQARHREKIKFLAEPPSQGHATPLQPRPWPWPPSESDGGEAQTWEWEWEGGGLLHYRAPRGVCLRLLCRGRIQESKGKAKDMVLDGSLCSLPRSSAFGLGIAAIVCLSIAQIVGASAAAGTSLCLCLCSGRNEIGSIALLIISWISFGLAAILLGTGSSMNGGQPYGKGWLDGECYVVNKGVYAGAAVLNVATVVFILGFILSTRIKPPTKHRRTAPGVQVQQTRDQHQQQK